jgi:hypothetical protein
MDTFSRHHRQTPIISTLDVGEVDTLNQIIQVEAATDEKVDFIAATFSALASS